MRTNCNKGYSIMEVLMAIVIIAMLFVSTIGAYMFISTVVNHGLLQYQLNSDVNTILARIIRGAKESSGAYGIRPAAGYTLPSATELRYVGVDGKTRRYYLNGTSIVYESPTQWPNSQTVYTAPSGASVTLRFWEPVGYSDHETVGIYIAVSKTVSGVTAAGALSTYVNIRNLPK